MRLANRTKEVEFFKKMLLGQIAKRILLIKADSGMGKTSLLCEFASLCPEYTEAVELVQIDLKSAQTGIAYIFSRLQRRLGEGNFTRFNAELHTILSGGVQVSDNQIEGTDNQIQVILDTESEEVVSFRLMQLQKAFFQDLQAIKKPIVIILDTFHLAHSTVADWIVGGFLVEVADVKNIRVVIAGQTVPKPTIEWMNLADTHCLGKIYDVDIWHSFLQSNGLMFERETVEAFVLHLDGQPSMIVKALESVARRLNK